MKLIVTHHAQQRAVERFPEFFSAGTPGHTKGVLKAIGYRGEPVGDSYIQGVYFRKGQVKHRELVVVVKQVEPEFGEERAVIVTCLTPEELEHNGNNRWRVHDDQARVFQKV